MKRIARQSLTSRLTLLFASISTLILLLLGLLVGALVEHHFEELDRELLGGKLELLRNALRKVPSEQALIALSRQLNDALVGHHGLAVLVRAPDGRTLFSSGDAAFPEFLLAAGGGRGTTSPALWTNPAGQRFRGISAEVPTRLQDSPPVIVAVATELAHHERFMQSFQTTLWLAVGSAALLTGLLGWVAARRGLAPLKEMRQRAADITANRLDQRLVIGSIPIELAEVAETLNGMLARLQESFHRLSDFSSDLAHELRTPVSNLLTQTQVILSKSRTAEEYRDVLASNVEELERLSRMIADMLFLAKADNKLLVPHRERVDLSTEAHGLFEFYEVLVEEKGIRLTCSGQATISGDKLMLRRALSNLLSNAIRHTPAGGRITVRIDDANASVVGLSVENTGETIPAEHLPRLFDRFYRVDTSRRHFGDGAGLGLSIVKSIVEAHHGTIRADSAHGVNRFEITLPRA